MQAEKTKLLSTQELEEAAYATMGKSQELSDEERYRNDVIYVTLKYDETMRLLFYAIMDLYVKVRLINDKVLLLALVNMLLQVEENIISIINESQRDLN